MTTKRPRIFDPQRHLTRMNNYEEYQKLNNPDDNQMNDQNDNNNKNSSKINISIPKVIELDKSEILVRNTEKELIEKKIKNSLGYVRIPKEQNVPELDLYELTDKDFLYYEEYKSKPENKAIEVKDFQNLIVFFEVQSGKEKIAKIEDLKIEYQKAQIPKISTEQMQELFGYWKSKRERNNRPLLRRLQNAIPGVDDNNYTVTFRPQPPYQEKMKTRKQTDQEGLIKKFHQLTKEFEEHHILVKSIQAREHIKYSIAYEKNEKLSDTIFKMDKQANFKYQGMFQCESYQEYEQKKKQIQQHKILTPITMAKHSKQEINKFLGTGIPSEPTPVHQTKDKDTNQGQESRKTHKRKNNHHHNQSSYNQLQDNSVNSQAMYQDDNTLSQQGLNNPSLNSLQQASMINQNPIIADMNNHQMTQIPLMGVRNQLPGKNQGKGNIIMPNPNLINLGQQDGQNILPLSNNFFQQPMPSQNPSQNNQQNNNILNNMNNNPNNNQEDSSNIIKINPQEELLKQQQNEENYLIATLLTSLFMESKKYDVKPSDIQTENIGKLNEKIQNLKGAPKEKQRQTEKRKQLQHQQLNKQLIKFKQIMQQKQQSQPQQENKKAIHFNIYRKTGRNGITQIYRSFDKLGPSQNNRQKIIKQTKDYIQPQLVQDQFIEKKELYETYHYYQKIGQFVPYLQQDEFEEQNNILFEDENEDQSSTRETNKINKEDDELFDQVKSNLMRMKNKIEEMKNLREQQKLQEQKEKEEQEQQKEQLQQQQQLQQQSMQLEQQQQPQQQPPQMQQNTLNSVNNMNFPIQNMDKNGMNNNNDLVDFDQNNNNSNNNNNNNNVNNNSFFGNDFLNESNFRNNNIFGGPMQNNNNNNNTYNNQQKSQQYLDQYNNNNSSTDILANNNINHIQDIKNTFQNNPNQQPQQQYNSQQQQQNNLPINNNSYINNNNSRHPSSQQL